MIISFSSRHRAQFRFPFLPAGVCLTMVHLIENCRFSFFSFQTCLDNSVSCLYFSLRRDFKWFLYLVLKSFLYLVLKSFTFRSTCNGIERSSSSHHTVILVYIYIYIYIYIA